MRLLVVEDDVDLSRTLRRSLEEEGFAVDVVGDGEEALFSLREIKYDAAVLDLMLPRMNGWDVLESARKAGVSTPILILTARDAIAERVRGLNRGADDYLTKPFEIVELAARLRAIIRRSYGHSSSTIEIGDVTIDTASREVFRDGAAIEVTPREYAILELLTQSRGAVVPRSKIYEHIYDETTDVMSNVIDVHVAALRRKLGSEVIRTRRGEGYIIDA